MPDSDKAVSSFELDTVLAHVSELVTHSFKIVNSNCKAGGLRAKPNKAVASYFTSLALLNPVLDYTDNGKLAGKIKSAVYKFIHLFQSPQTRIESAGAKADVLSLFERKVDKETLFVIKVTDGDKQTLSDALTAALTESKDITTQSLDPRLKQVVIPFQDSYLSLTPLYGAGLGKALSDLIWSARRDKKQRSPKTISMNYGGANKQNIGGLGHHLSLGLAFDAVSESPELKRAYAIYYNGIHLAPNRQLIIEWFRFRHRTRRGAPEMPTSLRIANNEARYLSEIVNQHLARIGALVDGQFAVCKQLPDHAPVDPSVLNDPLQHGFFEAKARDPQWARRYASQLLTAICQVDLGDKRGKLILSNSELTRFEKLISQGVR